MSLFTNKPCSFPLGRKLTCADGRDQEQKETDTSRQALGGRQSHSSGFLSLWVVSCGERRPSKPHFFGLHFFIHLISFCGLGSLPPPPFNFLWLLGWCLVGLDILVVFFLCFVCLVVLFPSSIKKQPLQAEGDTQLPDRALPLSVSSVAENTFTGFRTSLSRARNHWQLLTLCLV